MSVDSTSKYCQRHFFKNLTVHVPCPVNRFIDIRGFKSIILIDRDGTHRTRARSGENKRHAPHHFNGTDGRYTMIFLRNVISTYATKILITVITFATSIIIARFLGPAGKGTIAALATVNSMAVTFGTFGQHAAVTYFTARDKDRRQAVFTIILIQSAVVGTALILILLAIYRLAPSVLGNIPSFYFFIFIIQIPFNYLTLMLAGLLLGREEIRLYNALSLATPALTLISLATLIATKKLEVSAAIYIYTAANLITAIAYLAIVAGRTGLKIPIPHGLLKDMLSYGIKFYFNGVLFYLVIQSDILLVNYIKGQQATGVYSITAQFTQIFILLPISAGTVVFPKLSRSTPEERLADTTRLSRVMVALMLTVIGCTLAVLSPAIKLLFGDAFMGAVRTTYIIAPGIFFLSVMHIYAYHLASTGLPVYVPLMWGITFAINLTMNLLLIPRWGIEGAAFSSSVSYTFIFAAMFCYILKTTGARPAELLIIRRSDIKEIIVMVRGSINIEEQTSEDG